MLERRRHQKKVLYRGVSVFITAHTRCHRNLCVEHQQFLRENIVLRYRFRLGTVVFSKKGIGVSKSLILFKIIPVVHSRAEAIRLCYTNGLVDLHNLLKLQ